jgi:hypothetical protein
VTRRSASIVAGSLALAWTCAAYARVGGGGGYSGGGHGGGGGGGDAGLVFALVRLLLWLVFAHPVLGIPLVIVIVLVVLNMAKSGALRGPSLKTPRASRNRPQPARPRRI